ncbi:MAG: GAF domain-containing protein, partial [Desulfofustis sp.]|nr:GAF domain-containing protein [Desulfofustis sp.]
KEYSFHSPNLIPASRIFYISPEQTGRANRTLDYRTDLYSLGATLYELVTGTLPFETTDPIEQVHCHLARQPVPPHEHSPLLPREFSKIIMKLLEKSPENRFQNCSELRARLLRCFLTFQEKGAANPPDPTIPEPAAAAPKDTAAIALSEDSRNLGMMSVIKASRAFTGEIFLDELLKKLIVILLENAGGQRGYLLMNSRGKWFVRLKAEVAHRLGGITIDDAPGTKYQDLARNIIEDAIKSRKTVVLNNTRLLESKSNSILCMPIMHQEEMLCIIYLENNLISSAFHSGRLEILNLLATQAAHSIRNARLYEELEKTVSELHQEAEKHKKTQMQLLHAGKLSALSRLSASIAHEFGNPLIGIKYLLDDLHTRAELGSEDKNLIDAGLRECEHMGKLINNLHNLRKPSSGTKKSCNLNEIINDVLVLQRRNLAKRGIKVRTELARGIPPIEAVEDQITQVVVNLSMNAADAMEHGGGKLQIKTAYQNGRVVMSLADSGCGILPEHQERIFEPFFSTKTEIDGTGLGLAIAYSIIKNHAGEIEFTSESGKGTTFTISLPV